MSISKRSQSVDRRVLLTLLHVTVSTADAIPAPNAKNPGRIGRGTQHSTKVRQPTKRAYLSVVSLTPSRGCAISKAASAIIARLNPNYRALAIDAQESAECCDTVREITIPNATSFASGRGKFLSAQS